eukprot:9682155-Ditylum_brightwellii.AAC.1
MAWFQIRAKRGRGDDNNDNEMDLQDFLAPNIVQTIATMYASRKKLVIELANEESDPKSDSSDSAFKKRPFKTAKKANARANKKVQKEEVKKPMAKKAEHLSVKKPDMESSIFYILQQQMKQREDKKASRGQQLLIVCIECDLIENQEKNKRYSKSVILKIL